jgi:hypothetical protein
MNNDMKIKITGFCLIKPGFLGNEQQILKNIPWHSHCNQCSFEWWAMLKTRRINHPININIMRDWLRTLIAGYAGYKWGGGCLGFIVVFGIVYWVLGQHGCH